jgi:hypothetical protein
MSRFTQDGIQIHFAVSEKIGVSLGKDSVAHLGLSIDSESYNSGRTEGRNSSSQTSDGVFVVVKSPYRADGLYLTLSREAKIKELFKEFVDGYLDNSICVNPKDKKLGNTVSTIPDVLLNELWFIKDIEGLSQVGAIQNDINSDPEIRKRDLRKKYPLFDSLDLSDQRKYIDGSDEKRVKIIVNSSENFSRLNLEIYREIAKMSVAESKNFVQFIKNIKANLTNRIDITQHYISEDFNKGIYKMIAGDNCVHASYFFLTNGFEYVKNNLNPEDKNLIDEVKQIIEFVDHIKRINNVFCIPWKAFRRARLHAPEFTKISFIDTVDDKIFWFDKKIGMIKSRMTDAKKEDALKESEKRDVIDELTRKTDVINYEKEGLEFVVYDKLSDSDKEEYDKYGDIMTMFNVGSGGGSGTRYDV